MSGIMRWRWELTVKLQCSCGLLHNNILNTYNANVYFIIMYSFCDKNTLIVKLTGATVPTTPPWHRDVCQVLNFVPQNLEVQWISSILLHLQKPFYRVVLRTRVFLYNMMYYDVAVQREQITDEKMRDVSLWIMIICR